MSDTIDWMVQLKFSLRKGFPQRKFEFFRDGYFTSNTFCCDSFPNLRECHINWITSQDLWTMFLGVLGKQYEVTRANEIFKAYRGLQIFKGNSLQRTKKTTATPWMHPGICSETSRSSLVLPVKLLWKLLEFDILASESFRFFVNLTEL